MKHPLIFYCLCLLVMLVFCQAVINDNPYFKIEAKDVVVKIPKGFPKPLYTFKNNAPDPGVFVLGRKLFYDPLLSKDQSVSCATCHQRIAAFAHIDHRLSHGIYAKIGTRNVPALQNLIWKDSYMWDGGVNNLEVQPVNPITNPIEMDESLVSVLLKLRSSKEYRSLFQKAYNDTLISSERLLKALTQFTGLMISSNARYDKFMSGKDTLSIAEKKGLKLFRAKCGSCHKEPLFTDNAYRSNGLPPDTSLKDKGRAAITGLEKDNYCFNVPGLRNVQMTYPYMHDGRFKKLEDVLAYYADPNHFSKHGDPRLLKIGTLTKEDQKNIHAFLLTLTDKEFLYDRRFADPNFQ